MECSWSDRLRRSVGPLLAHGDGYLIDARGSRSASVLGYNAGPRFGAIHHPVVWGLPSSSEGAWDDWSTAARIRDAIESEIAAQYPDQIEAVERSLTPFLEEVAACAGGECVSLGSLAWELCWSNSAAARAFVDRARRAGILLAPPVGQNVQVHANLAFRGDWGEEVGHRLVAAAPADAHLEFPPFVPPDQELEKVNQRYRFHEMLLERQCASAFAGDSPSPLPLPDWFQQESRDPGLALVELDAEGYRDWRSRILALQSEIYEPARQSPPAEFDALFRHPRPVGLLVLRRDELVAMTFAGPLDLFREERGVPEDPWVDDPGVYYSMDLTVTPGFRGGLGTLLKWAQALKGIQMGVRALHGRNRDRVARGMWAINLSLGGWPLRRLIDDYPDQGRYRDCIYYRCPLHWNSGDTNDRLPLDWRRELPLRIHGDPSETEMET